MGGLSSQQAGAIRNESTCVGIPDSGTSDMNTRGKAGSVSPTSTLT